MRTDNGKITRFISFMLVMIKAILYEGTVALMMMMMVMMMKLPILSCAEKLES